MTISNSESLLSELLLIRISIPPRHIERLLDSLARLPFPLNPELKYEEWQTHVEFPAYRSWLRELENMLARERLGSTISIEEIWKS